jgi:hypothetical protein
MIRSLALALALPLSLSLVACTATVNPNPEPTSSSGSASNAGSATGAQTVVGFSCDGSSVTKGLGLELDVSPRCGNGTETDCGGNKPIACTAQDVTFSYPPPAVDCDRGIQVFSWDGTACVGRKVVGSDGNLLCKGSDCPKLFQTEEACRTAYTSCL